MSEQQKVTQSFAMSEDSLNLVLQKIIKQNLIKHVKNTNKIRETHIFWWYISNYGEIR
mgnify:CR=1 FL=1